MLLGGGFKLNESFMSYASNLHVYSCRGAAALLRQVNHKAEDNDSACGTCQ